MNNGKKVEGVEEVQPCRCVGVFVIVRKFRGGSVPGPLRRGASWLFCMIGLSAHLEQDDQQGEISGKLQSWKASQQSTDVGGTLKKSSYLIVLARGYNELSYQWAPCPVEAPTTEIHPPRLDFYPSLQRLNENDAVDEWEFP